jgi:hypothetical protein
MKSIFRKFQEFYRLNFPTRPIDESVAFVIFYEGYACAKHKNWKAKML